MILINIGINEIFDYLFDFNLSNGELFVLRVWFFFYRYK